MSILSSNERNVKAAQRKALIFVAGVFTHLESDGDLCLISTCFIAFGIENTVCSAVGVSHKRCKCADICNTGQVRSCISGCIEQINVDNVSEVFAFIAQDGCTFSGEYSQPIFKSKCALVYNGKGLNLGIAGLPLVVIKDLVICVILKRNVAVEQVDLKSTRLDDVAG